MKIELKHGLDFLEIDTDNQSYSLETKNKELFDMLFCADRNEAYFEKNPSDLSYVGWGDHGDHGEEFTEVVIKNLGIWLMYYPNTVNDFTDQVNHTIYSEAEEYYQNFLT